MDNTPLPIQETIVKDWIARSGCCDFPMACAPSWETDEFLEKTVFCTKCFKRFYRVLKKNPEWNGDKTSKKWTKHYREFTPEEVGKYGEYEIV